MLWHSMEEDEVDEDQHATIFSMIQWYDVENGRWGLCFQIPIETIFQPAMRLMNERSKVDVHLD